MKRALLGSIAIAVLTCTTAHASFTVPDAVFWGSVEIEGADAPAGTIVSGRVAGVELANHVLGSDVDDPDRYTLRVPMSHPDSFFAAPLPGTAFPGSSVQFFIDGSFVAELVLEAGELTQLNLDDAGSPPPTFTATPLPPTPTVTPTRPVGSGTRTVVATRTRTPDRTPGGATATMTRVVTGSPSATPSGSATPSPSPTPITGDASPTPTTGGPLCILPCTGDCNGNCRVAINELIVTVDVSLTGGSVDVCLPGDPNEDRRITIGELITAVNRALEGCPLESP